MGRRAADAPLEGTPASTSGNDLGLFKPSTSLAKKLRKVIHLKEDATTIRKASKSSLTEKQKDRNFNDVRRGLFKSWEVAGLVVLSVTIGDKVGLSINRLEEIFSGNEFVGLCILISVVSMAISYWVAVRVTENKEW